MAPAHVGFRGESAVYAPQSLTEEGAFTLIELLVTVGLIAVLGALLMPALNAAKIANSRTISVHSLRTLGTAGRAYLNDHDNRFWKYMEEVPGGTMWWFGFEPGGAESGAEGERYLDYTKGPLGPYAISSSNVQTDPAFLAYSPRLKPKFKNGNYGYGYNVHLASDPESPGTPRNALRAPKPGELILFATCAQINTFQAPASGDRPMIEEFYMINDFEVTVHFRHGDKALAVFLDGSVRDLPMARSTLDRRMPSANIGRFAPPGMMRYLWN